LEEAGVQNATFNILTPFPGTPLFRKMEAEGRILTRDWRKYNSRDDLVYQPKQMSAAELSAGFIDSCINNAIVSAKKGAGPIA
jgi:radical SAM superfamily enzyme YgiQ (UPF0313 family)